MAAARRTPDGRPHKEVNLPSGMQTAALFDTGSAITAISERLFEQLKGHARRIPEIEELIHITTVDGNPLPTSGCFQAELWLDGKWRSGDFFVMENLTSELLLGIDYVRKHRLAYDPDDNRVWAKSSAKTMRTRKETRIPAGSRRAVGVRCGEIRVAENEVVIATIGSCEIPVAGTETMVSGQGPNFDVFIDNVLDVDLVIPRGTEVGALESVALDSCKKIELEPEDCPEEKEPPMIPCDKEKEEMLRAVMQEQMKDMDPEVARMYLQLVLENHDVFSKDKSDLGRTSVMEHKIKLKDEDPAYNKQFRIPESHRSILIEHLQNWLKIGVVSPCKSHWNSPIFLVPKKDGSMRPVLDFREVNKKSVVDKYSAREVSDCIDEIGRSGSTVFSSLDLTAGFWQLPLEEESRPYTAFTIPGVGSFAWNCTPMGLLGSPATFGRMMEFIMRYLQIIAYQDDLLAHSKTHREQIEILKRCFARLRANNLKLNAKKCAFGQPEIPYLGFTLTKDGVLPGKDKTAAIRDSRPPRTQRQVREFTGLCNYFRASIKDFAKLAAPLNQLLTKEKNWRGGDLPEEALEAYLKLKEALMSPPVLAYPNPKLDYHLVVDASLGLQGAPGGLGASLVQIDEQGIPRAVGFASRGLTRFEKNYTSYLAELTACVFGIDYFQVYLKGRHFFLYTDHRPMEKLSTTHKRTLNRLQQLMGEYDFTIRYKPGKDNEIADFLSRNPISAIDVAGQDLKNLQEEDELIQKILETWEDEQAPESLKRLRKSLIKDKGILFFVKPDKSRAIFAPKKLQPEIIRAAHNSLLGGHMGVFKSRERILGRYFWPSVAKDVEEHVKGCVDCQKVKPWNRPKKAPLKPLEQPTAPNHRIHIDLFGPLATSGQGKKMVCVITDAFTKYTELVAVRSKEAGEVARAIMSTWITRYSTPKEIVTDGGKEFANKLMEALCQELRILHRQTTPYHPETNASAEVFNRTMKLYLATALEQPYLDWEELLPALRICYNTSVSKATQATPFSLVFGMRPNMPFFDLEQALSMDENYPEMLAELKAMREKAKEINLKYKAEYKKQYDKSRSVERQRLRPGDRILVENTHKVGPNPKFHPAFNGPFEVTKVVDLNIHYKDGKKDKVAHMNRVKPAQELTKDIPEASGPEKRPRRKHSRGSNSADKKGEAYVEFPGSDFEAENEPDNGSPGTSADQQNSEGEDYVTFPGSDFETEHEPDNGSRGTSADQQNVEGELWPIRDIDEASTTQHIPEGERGGVNGANGAPEDIHMQTLVQEEEDVRMMTLHNPDATILPPDSPFPPTPAPTRKFARARRGEARSGAAPETRRGPGASTAEPKKRKPSGELAQEQKRAASEVSLVKNLRSHGREQMEQSLPQRAREYRSYTRKTCAPSEQEQSS